MKLQEPLRASLCLHGRGMARHNYLIGHNTSPDRNKPNPSPNRPHAAEPTRKALVTRES